MEDINNIPINYSDIQHLVCFSWAKTSHMQTLSLSHTHVNPTHPGTDGCVFPLMSLCDEWNESGPVSVFVPIIVV